MYTSLETNKQNLFIANVYMIENIFEFYLYVI